MTGIKGTKWGKRNREDRDVVTERDDIWVGVMVKGIKRRKRGKGNREGRGV